jgi:peptidoglycan/LPS O-acetylase OafA/YrhL
MVGSGGVPSGLAAGGGQARRLPYNAALDGLRACAVLAVLLYHAEVGVVRGGFLGVEIFFVISGYLITSLLLAEHRRDGALDLREFWLRRARRLLPAFFVVLLATLAYAVVFLPDEVASMRGDAVAALGYVANWYQVLEHRSYFDVVGRPSPFQHFWSLAVEEQFYLVWPLALAALLRRRGERLPLAVAAGVAVLSSALVAYLYRPDADPSRIYYGTDTRAGGLMAGAALAFVCCPGWRWRRAGPVLLDLAGFGSFAVLAAVVICLAEFGPLLYRGGLAGVDLATALLLAVVVHRRPPAIAGLLRWKPLVWIGVRSYGIYLWHWPVFALTRPGVDVPLDGWPLLVVRLAATGVLADLSYRHVETPIRDGALGRAWRACRTAQGRRRAALGALWTSGAGAIAASAVLVGACVAGAQPAPPPPYLAAAAISVWHTPSGAVPAKQATTIHAEPSRAAQQAALAAPQSSAAALAASGGAVQVAAGPGAGDAEANDAPQDEPVESEEAEAADAGDATEAEGTAAAEAPPPDVAPEAGTDATPAPDAPPPPSPPTPESARRVAAIGDSVMLGAADALQHALGPIDVDAAVSRQVTTGIQVLEAHRAAGEIGDVVIVHLGNNGLFSARQFDALMRVLAGVPRVVIVTVKVPRPWEAPNNAVLAAGAARYPNTVLADWRAAAAGRSSLFWPDGLHLRADGAQFYANVIAAAVNASPPA